MEQGQEMQSNMNKPAPPSFLGLKILVGVMGVLIMAGVIVLAVTVVSGRFGRVGGVHTAAALPASRSEVRLALPPGFRAVSMTSLLPTEKAGGLLAMLLQDGVGHQAVLLYDPIDGKSQLVRFE